MRALIITAHPEPGSFCAAMGATAASALREAGHEVDHHDLYREEFDPVSDRRNFTTVKDADYFKQQAEESHASQHDGFAPELDMYMSKIEACDLLVFNFPLWWFGMPAVLKGWVDRVFAAGRMYGGPKLYEGGIGGDRARGLVLMTTGGGTEPYGGFGVNPPMSSILDPIEHGIFWFNGIRPLEPFITWGPARMSDEERAAELESLNGRIVGVFDEEPRRMPRLEDFPRFGLDTQQRFVVVVERAGPIDESDASEASEEFALLERWRRDGRVLSMRFAPPEAEAWRGFIELRAPDEATVQGWMRELPLAGRMKFEVTRVAPLPG